MKGPEGQLKVQDSVPGFLKGHSKVLSLRRERSELCVRGKTLTLVEGGVTVQIRAGEGLAPRGCLGKEGKGCL